MSDDAEKLEACIQENRELVYVLSHDLREPLRMVTSYMDLFSGRYGGQLDEAADEFIQYALEGARRAELMLDGLLSYSRVVNRETASGVVDVGEVVEMAVERVRVEYPDVSFGVECATMPALATDRHLLSLLWAHLLDNAVKFRDPQRTLRIGIEASRQDRLWAFRVSDNGIGFEPRFAERIFGVFHCLHPVGRYPGVGIGLAICRRIVERLGGEIRAEGRPGEGAVLIFTLPAAA